MRYTVRPLSDRTAFTGQPTTSPFRSTWSDTLELLGRELEELQARDVVLELDVTEADDLRLDGMVRSNAKIATPGVRLAFESRYGPLTYATDRFVSPSYRRDMTHWQHNVRAIALGLEALRKVDRYGITKRGEQYAGWKALPSGSGEQASHMTFQDAVYLFDEYTDRDWSARDTEDLRHIYRRARAAAHPDRHSGDRTLWDQVEQAARVLGVA